jgi:hypothetical protein
MATGKFGEYHIHDNNEYWLTVYDCMYEGDDGEDGPSGEYPAGEGNQNLYYSALWVGVRKGNDIYISDGMFSFPEFYELGEFYSSDSTWPGGFTRYGDYDTSILCNDAHADELGPIPILVRRQTWSFTDSSQDDFIGFKYIIQNDSSETFDEIYVSYYTDFDVDSTEPADDAFGSDAGHMLGYTKDYSGNIDGYFGVTYGTGDWTGVGYTVWAAGENPQTDEERFTTMQNYGWPYGAVPDDWRFLTTLEFDPADFEPGETIVAGFFQVAGDTLSEIRTNAAAARASYVEDDPPLGIENIKSASLGEIKAMFR